MRISDWSSDVCSSDLAKSVEDRFPHRIEQEKSDGIAKQCAQNRRQCTYEGIIKGALRFGQAHGTQQHIGWDGEKAALRKADTEKPARRVMMGGLFKRPDVKASPYPQSRSLQFQVHARPWLGALRVFFSIFP